MDHDELLRFVKHSEGKVSPRDVGRLYQRAELLGRLPVPVQRLVVDRAGGDPTIGFVVEPYAFFLAYELSDTDEAERQLPPGYDLVETAMFADTAPRHCAIVGAFTVHTSVFWGSRVELYLLAERRDTGMLTWLICDYESNTISYDPAQGFTGASTSRAVVTTTHAGDVVVDVASETGPNRLELVASLTSSSRTPLDQRLWVEGNLSVDYGGRLVDPGSEPFGLLFDPEEMRQALRVPLADVALAHNTFGATFLVPDPFEAACFPYAQHFLTSSFPAGNAVTDRAGLEREVRRSVTGPDAG